LLGSRPRAGAPVIAVFTARLALLCAGTVVVGIEPYWGDYLVVFVSDQLALCTVGSRREWSPEPRSVRTPATRRRYGPSLGGTSSDPRFDKDT
jgi:hypothetical protein